MLGRVFAFVLLIGLTGRAWADEPEPEPETEPEPGTETGAGTGAGQTEVYETVVRAPVRHAGAASRVVLEGSELTTVPGTFGDPLRVVATLPGVLRSPFGLGYFLVRGASFENTGFFVDGFPVPLLYHLLAGPAVLSSRLVERLDFFPGGYPVAYGRFSAGVIALSTAPPPADRLHLEGEVDLFRAGALAVVPIAGGRGTVAAAVRRSYYDLFLPLIVDGLDVAYSDYQVRADLQLSPRLDASVLAFASHDGVDVTEAAGSGRTDDAEQTAASYAFFRVIASLRGRLDDRASITWRGMVGYDWTRLLTREPGEPDLGGGLDGTYLGQRLEVVLPESGSLRTTIGADLSATIYSLDTTFPAPRGLGEFPRPDWDPRVIELESEILQLGAALYVEHVLRSGRVELVPALRLDWLRYGEVSTVVPDPRVVFRLRATDAVVLTASTGLFTQPPTAQRLDPTLGTPSLVPQRSWQSSVGAQIELPGSIELSPTVFATRMWQLPRTANLVAGEAGSVGRVLYTADGEGGAYGLEVLLRRQIEEGLYGWLSYTLSRSERYLEDGPTVPFQFDQTHTLNVAASYRTGPWRFGARFTLSSGRPSPRIAGAVYDADDDDYAAERVNDGTRLPTYHQLDVRIDRDLRLGPVRASAYLDVINVYYAPNVEGRVYQYDFARSAALPGIPILPTIGIRGELP